MATEPSGRTVDPERVLEQCLVGRTVPVAEVEQPLTHVGGDDEALVGDVQRAQGGRLGVGDPQPRPVRRHREPRRLGEPRLVARPRRGCPSADVPPEHRDRVVGRVGGQVQGPQLVGARHRDDDPVDEPGQVPRGREVLLEGGAAARPLAQLLPGAGEQGPRAVGQPQTLDLVVAPSRPRRTSYPTRCGRRRRAAPARPAARSSSACRRATLRAEAPALGHEVGLEPDHLVVRGVGHDERPVRQRGGLAREAQRGLGGRRRRHTASRLGAGCPWRCARRRAPRRGRRGRGRAPRRTSRRRCSPRGR